MKFIAGIVLESRRISCVIAQVVDQKKKKHIKEGKPSVSLHALVGKSMVNDVILMDKGWPCNMRLITQMIQNLIAETEDSLNSLTKKDGTPKFKNVVRVEEIYLSVHGSKFHIVEGKIEKIYDYPTQITETEISKLLEESLEKTPIFRGNEKGNIMPVIHILPQKFYARDSAPITSPLGMTLSSLNCGYIAVSASEDVLNNINNAVSNYGELDINGTFFEPVPNGEYMLSDIEKETGTILINIGRRSSYMGIYKDGSLVFFKELDFGGDTVTFHIQKYLNKEQKPGNEFSVSSADEIKINHCATNPDFMDGKGEGIIKTDKRDVTEKELIDKCILPLLSIFLETFEKFFKRFLKNKKLDQTNFPQVVLMGGGTALKGMPELIKVFFKAKSVRIASIPPKSVSGIRAKLECDEELRKTEFISSLATINYAFNKPSQNDLYSWNEEPPFRTGGFFSNIAEWVGEKLFNFFSILGSKSKKA